MNENTSARREARNLRLNRAFQAALAKNDADGIVKNRFALLGYSYAEEDGGSGSGSALDSITAAAASLGSAYIASQAPNNGVLVPTRTNPAYGAGGPISGAHVFGVVVFGVLVIGALVFLGAK